MKSKNKEMKVGKKMIKLEVWDTAGQERFKSMTKSFFQKAKAIIITFDLTNQKSYDDVSFWMRQIETNCSPTITKVLVGKLKFDETRSYISSSIHCYFA